MAIMLFIVSVVFMVVSELDVLGAKNDMPAIHRETGALDGEPSRYAYVTFITSEGFLPAFPVLSYSLIETNLKHQVPENVDYIALVIKDKVNQTTIDMLKNTLYGDRWQFKQVDSIPAPTPDVKKRYDGVFTKLMLWDMTQYKSVVFLDLDLLIVGPTHDLFTVFDLPDVDSDLAACRDVAKKNYQEGLNSGIMAVRPSPGRLDTMLTELRKLSNYDINHPSQAFLNKIYGTSYTILSPIYNMGRKGMYQQWPESWNEYIADARILHYTGDKPWNARKPKSITDPVHLWHSVRDEVLFHATRLQTSERLIYKKK